MPRQYIVNAFEAGPFTGNPAAVVPLDAWLNDEVLQAIAAQNNLSETAFFVDTGDREEIALRWFTPASEIDLCGHATLATAHVLFEELRDGRDRLSFATQSGTLFVTRESGGYCMDFPAVELARSLDEELNANVRAAAGVDGGDVWMGDGRAFLMLEDAQSVARLAPDLLRVEKLPKGDLFVSAPGDGEFDIVTRVFAPGFGIPEDPATGSAHCGFAPWWCDRLGISELRSHQLSARGGYLTCRPRADRRVELVGACSTFSRGEIVV